VQRKLVKFEKDYINLFNEVYRQFTITLESFFDDPTYIYHAYELGKVFRRICNRIGKDPRFMGMTAFLNNTRKNDREFIEKVNLIKQRYADHPKIVDAAKPKLGKFDILEEKFYLKVDQIQPPVETDSSKSTSENLHLVEKHERDLILLEDARKMLEKYLNIPLNLNKNEEILDFRKRMTKEQKALIKQPLTLKQEIHVFEHYIKIIMQKFTELEENGWYNSILNYSKAQIQYLNKIAGKRIGPEWEEFRNTVRKGDYEFKDWLKRLKRKYEDHPQLELHKMPILNEEIRNILYSYKYIRRAFILFEQNKRIQKNFG
jgi:hypothetical protein